MLLLLVDVAFGRAFLISCYTWINI